MIPNYSLLSTWNSFTGNQTKSYTIDKDGFYLITISNDSETDYYHISYLYVNNVYICKSSKAKGSYFGDVLPMLYLKSGDSIKIQTGTNGTADIVTAIIYIPAR